MVISCYIMGAAIFGKLYGKLIPCKMVFSVARSVIAAILVELYGTSIPYYMASSIGQCDGCRDGCVVRNCIGGHLVLIVRTFII